MNRTAMNRFPPLLTVVCVWWLLLAPWLSAEEVNEPSRGPQESLVILQQEDETLRLLIVDLDGRVKAFPVPNLGTRRFSRVMAFDVAPSGKLVGVPEHVAQGERYPGEAYRDSRPGIVFLTTTFLMNPLPSMAFVRCVALSQNGAKLAVYGRTGNAPVEYRLRCIDMNNGRFRDYFVGREDSVQAMRWSNGNDSLALIAVRWREHPRQTPTGLYVIKEPLSPQASPELMAPPMGFLGLTAPYRPTWADNDQVLYFTGLYPDRTGQNGPSGVYRVRLGTGVAERVSDNNYHGSARSGRLVVCYDSTAGPVILFADHGGAGKPLDQIKGSVLGGVSQSGRYIAFLENAHIKFFDNVRGEVVATTAPLRVTAELQRAWWIKALQSRDRLDTRSH